MSVEFLSGLFVALFGRVTVPCVPEAPFDGCIPAGVVGL